MNEIVHSIKSIFDKSTHYHIVYNSSNIIEFHLKLDHNGTASVKFSFKFTEQIETFHRKLKEFFGKELAMGTSGWQEISRTSVYNPELHTS